MTLKEGDIINGRYRLVSERGRGTFGEVWQAWDEILDMEVALKIYISLDDRGVEEFKSEYRTAFKLNHPNLLHASYFDVVEKRPYLVMPYCPISSDQMIGKISEQDVWKFIRDVSSGLAYLHSKNILHRDIKPDNILLDDQGDYLISDFGISQKMRNTLRRNSVKDIPGSGASGTVGYMGPELFSASPIPVMATDIWALGATLFELLEGDLPFFGQGGVMLLHGAEIPNMKGPWSDSLKSTLNACLARDTWERPKADELEQFASARMAGSKVEAPWEKRWREIKEAEEKRVRQETERRRIIEEQKAEEARLEAKRKQDEDKQRNKEEKRLRKEEEKRLKQEARNRDRESEKDKRRHSILPWVAALAIIGGVVVFWKPWGKETDPVQEQTEQGPVASGDNSGVEPETQQEPAKIIEETDNQQSEEEHLAAEEQRKEQERLANERKEQEELAKKKAAEEAAKKAEEAKPVINLRTAVSSGDWSRVKQLADGGDTDACVAYANHCFGIDYDAAHRYAVRAGRAKGTSIVRKLRDLGYYDDAPDPGW